MSLAGMCRDLGVALVIGGLTFQAPLAWAQPLEVADVEVTRTAVESQVRELIDRAAATDPELAQELERQSELCLRDLGDGHLEDAGLVKEVETLREVQREVSARVLQSEVESKIAEAMGRGNTELAESMRTAFEAFRATGFDPAGARIVDSRGDLGGFGGPGEMMSRGDAQAMFEQAYSEAQKHDPEGAARMKEIFEAHERGEFIRPTPEMMEKMHAEMERYMIDRPEMADYAHAEWDRFVQSGPDSGDRYGSTETPEQAREAFERWAMDTGSTGRSQGEIDQIRAQFERSMASGENPWEHANEMGGPEMMGREMMMGPERQYVDPREAFERWTGTGEHTTAEVEHYREMMETQRDWEAMSPEHYYEAPERYVETNTDTRLEQRLDSNTETFVRHESHVADHNGDQIPETHTHDIYRHSDNTCHDHTTQGPASC